MDLTQFFQRVGGNFAPKRQHLVLQMLQFHDFFRRESALDFSMNQDEPPSIHGFTPFFTVGPNLDGGQLPCRFTRPVAQQFIFLPRNKYVFLVTSRILNADRLPALV